MRVYREALSDLLKSEMMRPCRTVKVSVIKMKPSYVVSVHAIEKRLDPYNIHASVLCRIMHNSIQERLNQPDVSIDCRKRYKHIKKNKKTFT